MFFLSNDFTEEFLGDFYRLSYGLRNNNLLPPPLLQATEQHYHKYAAFQAANNTKFWLLVHLVKIIGAIYRVAIKILSKY